MLGWRVVPTDDSSLSDLTRSNKPRFEQLFVASGDRSASGIALDRLTYALRRRAQHEVGVYFSSLSARTLVYKGMLTTEQLDQVFGELLDERMASALAVVHSRFSTNTFPAWELAHPFRMIAHNGEINTAKGNRNWMRAREALLASKDAARRPGPAVPDLHPGRLRLRLLRRGGGAAAPRRPLAAARDADDDPGGLGEQRPDGPEAQGLLRLPLLPDGAVGRPRRGRVHRRHPDRRRAGPQRSAARALLGHRRRTGRARLRGRGAGHPGREGGREGSAAAGPDVPGRPGRAPDHLQRRDQGPARRRGPVRGVAERRPDPAHRPARARARRAHPRLGHPPPAGVRLHRGGAAAHPGADGDRRRRADRLDGHRHPDRRPEREAAAAVRLLLPAVRPGDQPAAGRHPRGARHLPLQHHRPGAEPAGARSGVLSTPGAAVPGAGQRRPGQDRQDQPAR